MQEIYSTPIFLLLILTLVLFIVLAAVLLKLSRLRKQLKTKDYIAAIIFVPIFLMLFVLSAFHTSKIIFASDADRTVITGTLISTEMLPVKRQVEQGFLIVKLEDKQHVMHEIKISDVINPFSYTHNKSETSVFDTIGETYRVNLVKDMIVKIEKK